MESRPFIDTHVLIWLFEGKTHLISPRVIELIKNVQLWLSPLSILEIDYLYEVKKITYKGKDIFRGVSAVIAIEIKDDSFLAIINEASHIHWTRDAFDRLIVAQASLYKASLITKDRKIADHYKRAVW
ncbi:MAG: PIN domain-containing protein [Deltaproteobacteria bacterium]|nr:PIN domain-containing protein [Deltaproteobacteria bacterium]